MQLSQPQQHHHPSQLVYPPSSLQQTTIENAKRIHHLEHLIRAERQELDRLLVQNASSNNKRTRRSVSPSPSPTSTPSPSPPPPPQSPSTPPPLSNTDLSLPTVPTTPPALSHSTPHASPKGIMYPYQTSPYASPQTSDRKPPLREMAARGSHWSFVEKARFEAALHKFGPFAWQDIIRTVGTRSEKQVKAYAARYRRRKKLAAKAHLEATERLPIHAQPAPLPPSLQTCQPLPVPPTPPTSLEDEEQQAHSGSSDTCTLLPLQVDSLLPTEEHNVNDTSFCDEVFSANSLFDTPLEATAVELPDVNEQSDPSEVELLVDRALRGEFAMDDNKPDQQPEHETLADTYPTEFLNTVFTH